MKFSQCLYSFGAFFTAFCPPSFGQTTKPSATQPLGPKVVRLILHPVATSQPALQYQLLPPMTDTRPGDAEYSYQLGARTLPEYHRNDDKSARQFDHILDSDRASFSVKDATALLKLIGTEHIHDAARCEDARWDTNYRNTGINTLLFHLNDMRGSANAISIEGRLAIAQGDFARAQHCIQTEFAMTRQLNHEPFLVQGLVGAGIGILALDSNVEDWIVRAKSPNLFWELSNLPSPMIDLSDVECVERAALAFTDKPCLAQALDGTLPDDQWPRVIQFVVDLLPGPDSDVDREVAPFIAADLPAARKYLCSTGLSPSQAASVQEMKAVGSFWIWQYKLALDECWKGWNLPYPQAAHQIQIADKNIADESSHTHSPLLSDFLFHAFRGRFLLSNLDRRIAIFRIIEALRDYTANHGGQPPTSLDQIIDLPIPLDPITGKSFVYRFEKGVASIEALAPDGIPADLGRRYELTFVSP